MKPRFYPLLIDCIERGITRGYNRAHKHVESPTQLQIETQIHDCIMAELTEAFEFENDSL